MTRYDSILDSLYRGFSRIVVCVCGVILVYLTIISICCTSGFHTEATVALADAIITAVGGTALWSIPIAVILLAVMFGLVRCVLRISTRNLVVSLAIIVFTVQLVYIFCLRATGYGYIDSIQVLTLSSALADGDYSALLAPQTNGSVPYLSIYPFQGSAVILFSLFCSLFGSYSIIAIAICNAAFNTITFLSIVGIAACLANDMCVTKLTSLLTALFLPLMVSSTFIYGNEIGCGCSFLSLYLTVRAVCSAKPHYFLNMFASYVLLFAGLFAKPTFSIFLIAVSVIWMMFLIKQRQFAGLLLLIVLAVCANMSGSIGVRYLESLYGSSFGEGMPRIQWIAMGLTWEEGMAPGWWTPTQFSIWAANGFDSSATSAVAQSYVQDQLHHFISDPLYCFTFFNDKLVSEWTDPAFQTIYYSSLVAGDPLPLIRSFESSGSLLNELTILYLDGFTLLIFFFSVLTSFRCAKNKDCRSISFPQLLLYVCFLGGFICFFFWEAKPVYVLPYFLLLIPLAAVSLNDVYAKIDLHQFGSSSFSKDHSGYGSTKASQ